MQPRAITTLSFDVIGTLIDFEAGIREWFRAHLRDHDRPVDQDTILAAFAESEARLQREHPELSFTALLPRIYGDIARSWELDTDEAAALDFRDSMRDWPAFADAVAGLRQLHENYRLVAVTNADAWGLEAMSRTLGDPFDVRITADAAGATKPDAHIWQYMLAQLGAQPGEVLHCAASQYHDIASAHRAGLPTAWIERARKGGDARDGAGDSPGAIPESAHTVEPDIHVDSLATLIEYLHAPARDPEG